LAKLLRGEILYRVKAWRTNEGLYKREYALADIQLVLVDNTGKGLRMGAKRNTTFDTWLQYWCKHKKVPSIGIGMSYRGQLLLGIETAHDYGLKAGDRIQIDYPPAAPEDESIDKQFQAAVDFVKTAKDLEVTTDEQLALYGFYKCATVGPCNTGRPSGWDLSGQAKWAAWKAVGDIHKGLAKIKYCDKLSSLSPTWDANFKLNDDSYPMSPVAPTPRSNAMKMVGQLLDENSELPKDPLPLSPELEWCDCDLNDETTLTEIHDLLLNFYVSNAGGNFRISYSKDFLRWDLCASGEMYKKWQVGCRRNGKLVGFISGTPVKVSVNNDIKDASEINFFCLHSDYRGARTGSTNLARVMITEITRRVYHHGFRLALYTGAQELPHAMSRTCYYHRKLNVRKLIETNFSSLPAGMEIEELEEEYSVQEEMKLKEGHTIRPFEPKDAPECHDLLANHYNRKMDLYRVMTVEEVQHILTPQAGVIYSWVIEDPEGKVTDFVSFYSLPSSIVDTTSGEMTGKLENAYLW